MSYPGVVVTIRINPTDCMSVIDVMETVGLSMQGMSFPQMASLTLSSLLQSAREGKHIPTRDGFEYLQMMGPYVNQRRTSKKLEIAKTIRMVGSDIKVPTLGFKHLYNVGPDDLELTSEELQRVEAMKNAPISTEMREARTRLSELVAKKELVDKGEEGVIWQASDQNEYITLEKLIYG